MSELKQAITLPRMLLFVLGDVLGAGVYVLIGQIAAAVGGAVWAPFLLALAFALLTAFSYAELVALLTLRGIEESMRVNVVLTVIEVSGLVLAIVLGFATVAAGSGIPEQALQFRSDTSVPLAILAGAVLAYYAFLGFETSANVAEEAIDPRRTYPIALLSALAIAGVVYLLLGLALSMVVPVEELAGSTAPLLGVVDAAPIAFPEWLFALIALLAVSNGALLFSIAASRLLYGMAREQLLPPVFGTLLAGRRTPPVTIAV